MMAARGSSELVSTALLAPASAAGLCPWAAGDTALLEVAEAAPPPAATPPPTSIFICNAS